MRVAGILQGRLLELSYGTQLALLAFGIKDNPGLFQNPRFDAAMVQRQQFQRAHGVVLFSGRAWLLALDLCHQQPAGGTGVQPGFEAGLAEAKRFRRPSLAQA